MSNDLHLMAVAGILVLASTAKLPAENSRFLSHPPMRPLPSASEREMSEGRGVYVDPKTGRDENLGTREKPWRTLAHAAGQLVPGDVLYLRGGVYYEHVTIKAQGTREKPITIRSAPGELAVVDGGLREFFESPFTAWEPAPGGVAGEFRSVKAYPELGGREGTTNVLGNFGDSMIPLHGYRFLTDLQNDNEYFSNLSAGKTEAGEGIYCGPGVFYDLKTGYIHCRLAHTTQKALRDDNYRGETDPRKLPLVIAGSGSGSPLSFEETRYLRVQDLVARGSRLATVSLVNCENIEFDGVTAYGGSASFGVRDCGGLRLWNCALRGIAAPWTYRGSLKYRAIETRIFSASGWDPTGQDNHDFELAYSEFTDCVDGAFLGNVRNVRFHHNLLDNLSDDGIFLTANTAYDGTTPGGNVRIDQNLLSRCLTTFAFGVGHGRQKMTATGRQTGAGVFITRNVFDFRRPVMYQQPKENESKITTYGRMAGDHGGPLWEPMTITHNTILLRDPPFRSYYLGGMGGHLAGGSQRKVFNNLLVQVEGPPGSVLPPVVPPTKKFPPADKPKPKTPPKKDPLDDLIDGNVIKVQPSKDFPKDALSNDLGEGAKIPLPVDFQADGNLHWSYAEPPTSDLFAKFRNSPDFKASKTLFSAGWITHDVVADPLFQSFSPDWKSPIDVRPRPESPAINAGVDLPKTWPDPLRDRDEGRPDLGAIPFGAQPWPVGQRGRLTVCGNSAHSKIAAAAPESFLLKETQLSSASPATGKPAVIVQGYPAFDAPLLAFALRKANIPHQSLERTWLSPADYDRYGVVIIVGDLRRAKIEPFQYRPEDLKFVSQFLKQGGTLMLMRGNAALFATPKGREFLTDLTGGGGKNTADRFEILKPRDAWLKHLKSEPAPEWVNLKHAQPLRVAQGETLIGHSAGLATLYRLRVGQGQLIYVGWDIASSLPSGRSSSTVEQEAAFEQQMRLLENIVQTLAP